MTGSEAEDRNACGELTLADGRTFKADLIVCAANEAFKMTTRRLVGKAEIVYGRTRLLMDKTDWSGHDLGY